ncbi:MAG: hypothetical protein K2F76_01170 [Duncaniella dubosii]|nr:hypothetical protein [Duncaniella dubosii]
MKRLLILLSVISALSLLTFTSCRTSFPVSQDGGKSDIAYILIASAGNNKGNVDVYIDSSKPFSAKIVKERDAHQKGTSYVVSPGKHEIKIKKNGELIKTQSVFLSQQETKIILIP